MKANSYIEITKRDNINEEHQKCKLSLKQMFNDYTKIRNNCYKY